MERMGRGVRWDFRRAKQIVSLAENAPRKRTERSRRAARMVALVKAGTYPYTPAVLSWLSTELDKPGRLITQADIDGLLKQHSA